MCIPWIYSFDWKSIRNLLLFTLRRDFFFGCHCALRINTPGLTLIWNEWRSSWCMEYQTCCYARFHLGNDNDNPKNEHHEHVPFTFDRGQQFSWNFTWIFINQYWIYSSKLIFKQFQRLVTGQFREVCAEFLRRFHWIAIQSWVFGTDLEYWIVWISLWVIKRNFYTRSFQSHSVVQMAAKPSGSDLNTEK